MAYVLFHEAGLMETFHVPQREFINYFRALEANYGSNVCKYTRKIIAGSMKLVSICITVNVPVYVKSLTGRLKYTNEHVHVLLI